MALWAPNTVNFVSNLYENVIENVIVSTYENIYQQDSGISSKKFWHFLTIVHNLKLAETPHCLGPKLQQWGRFQQNTKVAHITNSQEQSLHIIGSTSQLDA